MEIIKNLIQTLIIIVVLAVFLEMLLPQGKMTPYVKMVMGLLIIVAVLQAISGLLQQNWLQEIPGVTSGYSSDASGLEDIMAAGKELQLNNQDLAVEQYRQGISGQVLALARMNSAVNVVDADVRLSQDPDEQGYGRITEIVLIISPSEPEGEQGSLDNTTDLIELVNIKIGDSTVPVEANSNESPGQIPHEIQREAQEVARSVAGFYSLSPEQVLIEYKKV